MWMIFTVDRSLTMAIPALEMVYYLALDAQIVVECSVVVTGGLHSIITMRQYDAGSYCSGAGMIAGTFPGAKVCQKSVDDYVGDDLLGSYMAYCSAQ
jgi:hypothetical protein